MAEDLKPKVPNVLELAKKKRHIHLLEKVQAGKALTASELAELKEYEGHKEEPQNFGVVKTLVEVSKAFKVSYRNVQYWVLDGMPKTPDGHYDLNEIEIWRISKLQEKKGLKDPESIKWVDRYRQFKALEAELDYKQKLATLVSREEIEQGRVQRILALKKAFLSLGKRIAPQAYGREIREIQDIVDKRVKQILSEFAEGLR
ncbi:MAG: hypothetical protein COV74_03465 [Candidatus Omnitrophica bacterium CG11_big_fil_rev_8_21_14_0_20_45_26]|uniref:Uncharacterized protein n=1 Tax=Candidatus Abzuiibacterium crystallinum TaxID=1974748 RepID=A0A2H0LQY9_9BACT|nr:MAG: hypothetical protein COV74_03465 [Candidatus Omnitrophica bacterium CG11_big_fil_rev_8_21_14_0_20_45_26]PIW63323.1 MAG: hypothetical protein COW12_10805 [Candidatus Omnitrophica bacterium CG12_big_fil_rev_8_21_14_0_65_45_16]